MNPEAIGMYRTANRAALKYVKNAAAKGERPYPPVLDEMLDISMVAGYADLGVINIPAELIVGTKTLGRVFALAGNFMPLLEEGSEFAAKWTTLYSSQLDEGIRDPIKCYEYLGKFYVEEGNKRVSVLRAVGSPTIPGQVTRVIPRWSEDPAVRTYYAFMDFYRRSGIYGLDYARREQYAQLQAALGFDPDHVWTEEQRRGFSAGFVKFRTAYEKLDRSGCEATSAEALLGWLKVFPFSAIKELEPAELEKKLLALLPDIALQDSPSPIEVSTEPEPEDEGKGLFSKLFSLGKTEHLRVAFIYPFDPDKSAWTRAHDEGRKYLEERFGDRIDATAYRVYNRNDFETIEAAIEDGAQVVFATAPPMIGACRRSAALHPDVKLLTCALALPYTGVRVYYGRIYESKFISGAVAGAMAASDTVGYVANYPIVGVPAEINAFALGVRMTNPRAHVRLVWSCTPGNPLKELEDQGVEVISNRVAATPEEAHRALEWGVWRRGGDGVLTPLVTPCWNWGRLYERIILSIFSGGWDNIFSSKAINYWWGFRSGVTDVAFSDALPEGVRCLAEYLKGGLTDGLISPFASRILDQNGAVRVDAGADLSPEQVLGMDWLCDNVDGNIPRYDEILPRSHDMVRLLGLHREELPPEKEEQQL
ncbi:MAG: BMP family ABC transporter substrate-binding protein [Oscillospiraceae bacterium]|nr:BMP family ABC transporter substrate-binding protein [Oscillospiraceae bacterium]